MKQDIERSGRREFLKAGIAGAAAVLVFPAAKNESSSAASNGSGLLNDRQQPDSRHDNIVRISRRYGGEFGGVRTR